MTQIQLFSEIAGRFVENLHHEEALTEAGDAIIGLTLPIDVVNHKIESLGHTIVVLRGL